MLVFIFVFPTQQDLWRHNNPSEPQESEEGDGVRTNACILVSLCSVRGFCVKCMFEECAWKQSWVCTENQAVKAPMNTQSSSVLCHICGLSGSCDASRKAVYLAANVPAQRRTNAPPCSYFPVLNAEVL